MAQEPVEHLEDNEIKAARLLMQSGRSSGNPAMVKRGARKIIKIRMRQLAQFMRLPLKPFDISLLAERRTKFVQRIRDKRDE